MNPVTVKKLEAKSLKTPDEVRQPDKTKLEIVRMEGFTIGRFNLQPGWRWSECIKPVVHTDSCQLSHVGYVVSGSVKYQPLSHPFSATLSSESLSA